MARIIRDDPPALTPSELSNFPYAAIPFPLADLKDFGVFHRAAVKPLLPPPHPEERLED